MYNLNSFGSSIFYIVIFFELELSLAIHPRKTNWNQFWTSILLKNNNCHSDRWLNKIIVWTDIYNLRPRRPPFLRVESEGMGVTSSILPIFMPERANARSALWAPGPGVLVLLPPVALSLMWRAVIPRSLHFSATSCKKVKKKFRNKDMSDFHFIVQSNFSRCIIFISMI